MRILSKIKRFHFVIVSLLALQCKPAAAQVRPIVSAALVYAKVDELGVKNKMEPSFAYGAIARKNHIIASIQTNRFIEQVSTRKAQNGIISRAKATSDNLLIGYAFDKFAPSLIISHTQIRKQLERDGAILADRTSSAILRGVNFTYYFSKQISGSTFYILPNHHLRIDGVAGVAVNLIF